MILISHGGSTKRKRGAVGPIHFAYVILHQQEVNNRCEHPHSLLRWNDMIMRGARIQLSVQ